MSRPVGTVFTTLFLADNFPALKGNGNVVELYYDCGSPYSWIAFEILTHCEEVLPFQLRLKPICLGAILRDPSQTSLEAARDPHLLAHIERLGKFCNTTLKQIEVPDTSDTASGVNQGINEVNYPGFLVPATREIISRVWSTKEPIDEEKHFWDVAEKIKLPEPERIIKEIESARAKVTLRRRTRDALKMGTFGAPWIVVKRPNKEDVRLFGGDRIHVIVDLLGWSFPRSELKSKI
ncbi:hypothetical protein QR680_009960 [Steinernema hermaphroditum]|uniref:DSBA-like thioredoxin domain-containing protein n=1 Tax=Steinernema hermaphroditum TaxID=289476 RepID=A0AA39MAU7_9BILA|nr:hypothetical protein QR680_009960 [Steinernema hermaphroditum]